MSVAERNATRSVTCQVVFALQALSMPNLHLQQTWICKTTATRVTFSHDSENLQFEMPRA